MTLLTRLRVLNILRKIDPKNLMKLTSRKLWVSLLGTLLITAADALGLPSDTVRAAVATLVTYLLTQSAQDALATRVADLWTRLRSRKFAAAVGTALLISLGSQLGLSADQATMLATLASTYILGQGAVDMLQQQHLSAAVLAPRRRRAAPSAPAPAPVTPDSPAA
jgi:hypothetical protein